VVALGTQAQTSVLHTGGEAALRGFKVIVPVDGMSADDLFPELYTAWHLANAARISNQGDADDDRYDRILTSSIQIRRLPDAAFGYSSG
jgi:nicotinamidase-related amidase